MSKLTKGLKKTGVIAAKVVGTTVLTATGVVSAVTEKVISVTGVEPLQDIAHGAKSASFNGIRKMWGAAPTEFERVDGAAEREKLQRQKDDALRQAEKKIEKYEQAHPNMSSKQKKKTDEIHDKIINIQKSTVEIVRRSDEELSRDNSGLEKPARSFDFDDDIPLSIAMHRADNSSGVYILWLDGKVMKCGRSSQNGGVRKRLLEYYGLRYDARAQKGDYWSVNAENRDNIMVSWQCCPISKCHELEYKLFNKYGKGPWALRAPISCCEDSWELLI